MVEYQKRVIMNDPDNPIPTDVSVPTGIISGNVILAVAAQPLGGNVAIKSVTIENVNTNNVAWHGSETDGQNYALRPGANISLAIDNLNKVYVRGTPGNVITWIAVT